MLQRATFRSADLPAVAEYGSESANGPGRPGGACTGEPQSYRLLYWFYARKSGVSMIPYCLMVFQSFLKRGLLNGIIIQAYI